MCLSVLCVRVFVSVITKAFISLFSLCIFYMARCLLVSILCPSTISLTSYEPLNTSKYETLSKEWETNDGFLANDMTRGFRREYYLYSSTARLPPSSSKVFQLFEPQSGDLNPFDITLKCNLPEATKVLVDVMDCHLHSMLQDLARCFMEIIPL